MSAGTRASQGTLVHSHRKSPKMEMQMGRTSITRSAASTHHVSFGEVAEPSMPISTTTDDAAQLATTQDAKRRERIHVPHRRTRGLNAGFLLAPLQRGSSLSRPEHGGMPRQHSCERCSYARQPQPISEAHIDYLAGRPKSPRSDVGGQEGHCEDKANHGE